MRIMTNSKYKKNNVNECSKLEEIMQFEETEYKKKRIEKKINIKLLTNEIEACGSIMESDEALLREVKILPKEF
jgi:hypothetical protein